jgi:hypothetical protein
MTGDITLQTFRGERAASIFRAKVKVKFTLEQATKAQKGSKGIALLFP